LEKKREREGEANSNAKREVKEKKRTRPDAKKTKPTDGFVRSHGEFTLSLSISRLFRASSHRTRER